MTLGNKVSLGNLEVGRGGEVSVSNLKSGLKGEVSFCNLESRNRKQGQWAGNLTLDCKSGCLPISSSGTDHSSTGRKALSNTASNQLTSATLSNTAFKKFTSATFLNTTSNAKHDFDSL